jgi:hypothetical protein
VWFVEVLIGVLSGFGTYMFLSKGELTKRQKIAMLGVFLVGGLLFLATLSYHSSLAGLNILSKNAVFVPTMLVSLLAIIMYFFIWSFSAAAYVVSKK